MGEDDSPVSELVSFCAPDSPYLLTGEMSPSPLSRGADGIRFRASNFCEGLKVLSFGSFFFERTSVKCASLISFMRLCS